MYQTLEVWAKRMSLSQGNMESLRVLPPNRIPPPFKLNEGALPAFPIEAISKDDGFTLGVVVKYFPYRQCGFVGTTSGREIYFDCSEVRFVGGKTPSDIKEGARVGFDVSHVGGGLRITRLKIY